MNLRSPPRFCWVPWAEQQPLQETTGTWRISISFWVCYNFFGGIWNSKLKPIACWINHNNVEFEPFFRKTWWIKIHQINQFRCLILNWWAWDWISTWWGCPSQKAVHFEQAQGHTCPSAMQGFFWSHHDIQPNTLQHQKRFPVPVRGDWLTLHVFLPFFHLGGEELPDLMSDLCNINHLNIDLLDIKDIHSHITQYTEAPLFFGVYKNLSIFLPNPKFPSKSKEPIQYQPGTSIVHLPCPCTHAARKVPTQHGSNPISHPKGFETPSGFLARKMKPMLFGEENR